MDFFAAALSRKSIAMNNNQILSASLLDIIFDGRNKEYGAYELRATYSKRIKIALSAAALSTAAFIAIAGFSRNSNEENPFKNDKMVVVQMLEDPEEIKPVEPPPVKPIEPPQTRTEQFTTITIEPDEEVKTPPPTQDELAIAQVDVKPQDGLDYDNAPVPAGDLDGQKGIIQDVVREKEPDIFIKVEKEAEFPGGMNEWLKFLERNCNGQVATDHGAATGRYTVIIRFVVDEEGNVSNLSPLTQHGFGMEDEAIRVIKKAAKKKWIPAIQNGRQVKAFRSQPITFEVRDDGE